MTDLPPAYPLQWPEANLAASRTTVKSAGSRRRIGLSQLLVRSVVYKRSWIALAQTCR